MKEDICSIPVNDMFVSNCGCPVCKLYNTLEKRTVDYIMGSAMMEPDVRVETNKVGFCHTHYSQMYKNHGKLQLALLLQSHINEFNLDSNKLLSDRTKTANTSCFVCDKIEWSFSKLINQIFIMYESDSEFRTLFNNQTEICLPHYKILVELANKKVLKKQYKEFLNNLFRITKSNLDSVQFNIKLFTKMYDYNSNKNSPEFDGCKNAVEQALNFVTGKNFSKE